MKREDLKVGVEFMNTGGSKCRVMTDHGHLGIGIENLDLGFVKHLSEADIASWVSRWEPIPPRLAAYPYAIAEATSDNCTGSVVLGSFIEEENKQLRNTIQALEWQIDNVKKAYKDLQIQTAEQIEWHVQRIKELESLKTFKGFKHNVTD